MSLTAVRIVAAVILLGAPLGAGWLAGFPGGFAEFPPVTVYIDPPGFSAPVYASYTALLILATLLYLLPRRFGFDARRASGFEAFEWAFAPSPGQRFPIWGWFGAALIAAGWSAAWLRPDWLGAATDHTFFPLWLGYVLCVDGLVYRRAGTSPASRHPGVWAAWFPASALMWWYFELLNRFIQNWVYIGADHFTPLRYLLGATLAFSTVIPAVLTTAALLGTFDFFRSRFVRAGAKPAASFPPGHWWWTAVAAGALGLALVPFFPIALFALIWIAPLLVVSGLLEANGRHTGLGHLLRGDWGPALTLGAAAFVCGLFWELWNFHALPKWIYQVPWVDRFKVFEMPLVGYLGYLPFGPACWAFWLLLAPGSRSGQRVTGRAA